MIDVACFGEILWDVFERRPGSREYLRELGGAPANVATGLARLGVRASVIGGVGRDPFGDALLAHLAKDGVATRFVLRFPNRTGVTFVLRGARGEPRFLFYRHESADLAVTAAHVTPAMGRAKWALVGTSTLMTPALSRATYGFLDFAAEAGGSVFVDLNVRAHLWRDRSTMQRAIARLVRRAAVVKASETDLSALGAAGERSGVAWLTAHAPHASWIITRGGARASAIGVHGEVNAFARRVRCVDATGAGDAFIAGTLAALLSARARPGTPAWSDRGVWKDVLEVGHTLGAKAVSRIGAVAGLVGLDAARARVQRMSGKARR